MTVADLKSSYPSLIPEDFHFEVKDGWTSILARFFASVAPMADKADSGWRLYEVRESNGALRITADIADPQAPEFLYPKLLAQFRSRCTCEVCGEAGFVRWTGWKLSRCNDHAEADQKSDRPRPAWNLGVSRPEGYLFYDQTADDFRLVAYTDLSSIGMPEHVQAAILKEQGL